MSFRYVLASLALLGLCAGGALAGDIIAMPTGNMVAPGNVEFHYILWDRDAQMTPDGKVLDYASIYEVHVGVLDRLELDYIWVKPQGLPQVSELNAYFAVIKESAVSPSVIVGATNLTGNNWLPSSGRPGPEGDKRVSPFVVSSYNLRVPTGGAPDWDDPLIRAHLGWGSNWHENRFFGGVQVALTPQLGFGIFNYQGYPAYLSSWKPLKGLEINLGWNQDNPLVHVGYGLKFADW